jgi:hypothetical protein
MAFQKGNKLGHRVKKGDPPLNPAGRPHKLITEKYAGIPNYTKTQVMDTFVKITTLTQDQLIDICADVNATALERTLAKAVSIGIFSGDMRNINTVIERVYGKPTQEINIEQTIIEKQVILLPDGNKLLL